MQKKRGWREKAFLNEYIFYFLSKWLICVSTPCCRQSKRAIDTEEKNPGEMQQQQSKEGGDTTFECLNNIYLYIQL